MAEIFEVNDLSALDGYRLVWDALLPDTPGATFLHTYDAFETYWRHHGDDKRLRVLIARAAGEYLGIMPLCVEQRLDRLNALRVLTYSFDTSAPFCSPIGKSQAATLTLGMRHLAATRCDWDLIDLPRIANDTTDRGRTQRAMQLAGLDARREPSGMSTTIDLSDADSWSTYLALLPRGVCYELRRAQHQLKRWGEVEFVRHRPDPRRAGDGDPRWDLYDACEQMACAKRRAASHNDHTFRHSRTADYARDLYAAAARRGMADLALLKLSGQPIAYWIGSHYQGVVVGSWVEYRKDALAAGVAAALFAHLLQDGIARGDKTLVLGSSCGKPNGRFCASTEAIYRLLHTPRTAWQQPLARASKWLSRQAVVGN